MTQTTEVDSAWSTGVTAPVGFNRNLNGAVGERSDSATVDASGLNSVSALLKGSASGLGVSTGSGQGVIDSTPRLSNNPEASIGARDDARVIVGADGSMVSILKGLLSLSGI